MNGSKHAEEGGIMGRFRFQICAGSEHHAMRTSEGVSGLGCHGGGQGGGGSPLVAAATMGNPAVDILLPA